MEYKNKDEKYFAKKIYDLITKAEQSEIFMSVVLEFGYCKIFIGETPIIVLSGSGVNAISTNYKKGG